MLLYLAKRGSNMHVRKNFELIKKYFCELLKNLKNSWINIIILNLIILFLDYFNIPSSILNKDILYGDCIFISSLMVVFYSLYLLYNQNYKCFKDKDKNVIDDLIVFMILFFSVNIITNVIMHHKLVINIFFIICGVVMIITRIIFILSFKRVEFESNTISCYDLYNNNLKHIKKGIPLLINDEPLTNIKTDLLDFKTIKDSLLNYCKNCHTKSHFVLGLTGKWGSGKTSLLNLIVEETNDEKIVFKTFRPWEYSSTEAMFTGLYNLITEELAKNGNKLDLYASLKKYKKALFEYAKNLINVDFSVLLGNDDFSVNSINKEINNILEDIDNELIIIIDDIDRLNQKDVVFLLKVIKNIISFNKVKYIISYDESRLRKILNFNNEYEEEYLDKIINAKLNIPSLDRESFKLLFITLVHNMLTFYSELSNEKELDNILGEISQDLNNMRDCIRFINSLSLSINTLKEYKLYLPDFVAIEYIKYKNKSLYNDIYNDYPKYRNISNLKEAGLEKLINNLNISDNQCNILRAISGTNVTKKDRRLLMSEYIYVYYGNKSNKYIKISNEIKILIKHFNLRKNIDKQLKNIMVDNDSVIYQDILMYNLDEVKNQRSFLKLLINNDTNFINVIQKLMIKINYTPEELEKIFRKNITLADAIVSNTKRHSETLVELKFPDKCKEILIKITSDIIENKINLYSNENYKFGQIQILPKYIEENKLKKYISEIISSDNIIRMLADNVTIVHNDGKDYISLRSADLNYFISDEKIEECISKITRPLNKYEKKVLRAYKNKTARIAKNFNLKDLDI